VELVGFGEEEGGLASMEVVSVSLVKSIIGQSELLTFSLLSEQDEDELVGFVEEEGGFASSTEDAVIELFSILLVKSIIVRLGILVPSSLSEQDEDDDIEDGH
jgi:hypothetical protein